MNELDEASGEVSFKREPVQPLKIERQTPFSPWAEHRENVTPEEPPASTPEALSPEPESFSSKPIETMGSDTAIMGGAAGSINKPVVRLSANPWETHPAKNDYIRHSETPRAEEAGEDNERETDESFIPVSYSETPQRIEQEASEAPNRKTNNETGTINILEAYMAAKKGAKSSSGKKPSATAEAMGKALSSQEKKSKSIEHMVSRNIATETSKPKQAPKGKKSLADIAAAVQAVRKKKAAAARAIAPKKAAKAASSPRRAAPVAARKKRVTAQVAKPLVSKTVKKAAPAAARRSTGKTRLNVPVESLGAGIWSTLGGVAGGTVGAVTGAASTAGAGAKSAVKSVTSSVKSFTSVKSGGKGKDKQGVVEAAAKTASQVTGKVAYAMTSTINGAVKLAGQAVSGVVGVAGAVVEGGVNAVSGTIGGLAKLVPGFNGKSKKTRKASSRKIPVEG